MAARKKKTTRIDLDKLTPEQRERVERVLHRKNYGFSIRTREDWADAWREAARREGLGVGEWVERYLNSAAGK